MDSIVLINILIFVFLFVSLTNCVRINYLNGLHEYEKCKGEENFSGTCKKIIDCLKEFDKQKRNNGVLNVCQFDKVNENTLICCPENPKDFMLVDDIDVRVDTIDSRFDESEETNSSSTTSLPLIEEINTEKRISTDTTVMIIDGNEEILETTTLTV